MPVYLEDVDNEKSQVINDLLKKWIVVMYCDSRVAFRLTILYQKT